jgi:hypothetical protein
MTTSLQPSGSAGDAIKSLRTLFVWAMLGYVALNLFFQFFDWLLPNNDTFASRSYFADFADLSAIVLPLLAVLLATVVQPALGIGKLAGLAALGLYAFTLFFDGITFLIGLGYAFDRVDTASEVIGAFGHLVLSLLDLAWVALAGFAVFKIFTAIGGKLNVGITAPAA